MRLVILGLVACAILLAPAAMAVDTKGTLHQQVVNPRATYMCNNEYMDTAFYQNSGQVYGNAFSIATAAPGEKLTTVHFWHYGWGYAGSPGYDYKLHVFDLATCTEVCVNTLVFHAPDAAAAPIEETIDVSSLECCLVGDVIVGIEPLTCLNATDCYPDIMADYTAVVDGCGSTVYLLDPPECYQIQSSSGPVDFLFDITTTNCEPVPAEIVTWGAVKSLYR